MSNVLPQLYLTRQCLKDTADKLCYPVLPILRERRRTVKDEGESGWSTEPTGECYVELRWLGSEDDDYFIVDPANCEITRKWRDNRAGWLSWTSKSGELAPDEYVYTLSNSPA